MKVRSQHCTAIQKKINENQMTQSSSQLNRKLAFALFFHKGGNLKCKLVNTLIAPKAFLISNLNNVLPSFCPNSQGFASCVSMTQEKDQTGVPAG